ncbi:MAG: GTP 3',8-cyclase MoaA [Planctomycetes bacterium]|nr:GTP 3',8-cyclase MoaA [Planctomycetota bacterium]
MLDPFGRSISYLRVSITDRCNLKCLYCTPLNALDYAPREDLLSYEEIVEILEVMVPMGIRKVRVTGGEPLVRRGVVEFLARLKRIEGLRKVAVTTNGIMLKELAEPLVQAGVSHINVSLDTLDPDRFREITRGGDLHRVLAGIDRLLELGVPTVKVNMVLMAGVNESEVESLARLSLQRPIQVRYIELMPVDHCGMPHAKYFLSAESVLPRLNAIARLEPAKVEDDDAGPATVYRFPGAPGTIGMITHLTNSFCDRCNRVRLTPEGQLRLCLFGDENVDLRAILRRPHTGQDLIDAVHAALAIKPKAADGYHAFAMQSVGG